MELQCTDAVISTLKQLWNKVEIMLWLQRWYNGWYMFETRFYRFKSNVEKCSTNLATN